MNTVPFDATYCDAALLNAWLGNPKWLGKMHKMSEVQFCFYRYRINLLYGTRTIYSSGHTIGIHLMSSNP